MKKLNVLSLLLVTVSLVSFTLVGTAMATTDSDNNPPGSKGGVGTNWENPPGPQGGPGASPDHRKSGYDKKADRNHDGIVDAAEQAERDAVLAGLREKRKEASASQPEYAPADRNKDGVVDDFEKNKP